MSVFSPPKNPTRHYVSLPPCGQTMSTTLNSPYWYFGSAITGNAMYWMVPPISSGTFYLTGFTLMCDNDAPPSSGTIQIKKNYSTDITLQETYSGTGVQVPIYHEFASPVPIQAGEVYTHWINGNATGSEFILFDKGYFEE